MTKGEESQSRIEEAAFNLIVKQGYHGTSMRQIAEAAGLTPASIYNHFGKKEDIFVAVLKRYHPYREIIPILETAEGDDVETILRGVAKRVYMLLQGRREMMNLLFSELVEFEGRHISVIFELMSPRVFAFFAKLRRATGELRPISDPNLLLNVIGLVMAHWMLDAVFLSNLKLPTTSKHFEVGVDIFLHGILLEKEQA